MESGLAGINCPGSIYVLANTPQGPKTDGFKRAEGIRPKRSRCAGRENTRLAQSVRNFSAKMSGS